MVVSAMSGSLREPPPRSSLPLLYTVAFLERADEALLPACYAALGATFGASPSELGMLTSARAALQAVACLPAGAAADRGDRLSVAGSACAGCPVVWPVGRTPCLVVCPGKGAVSVTPGS